MKRLMILGASILQLPAIEQAKKMGIEVIAVDMDKNAIGFKSADISLVISTIDIPRVVEAAKRYHIDGIITLASDMPMRTVAAVSKELNLVGITDETALKATNKVMMREALSEREVPIPVFYKVFNEEEFFEAIKKLRNKGYKCIVKPADNSGSRGVQLVERYEEKKLEEIYHYSKKYARSGELIVEEYMEGPEVSVEAINISGECHVIQITDKLTTGAPYFVEMGHNQPSLLSEEVQKEIIKITQAANRAIGINNGPSHTEIKITEEGPKIVEIGARLGGDNITTHLVPLSTGINLVECCIKVALGEKTNIESQYRKASAIRYIETDKGTIEMIEGIEKAKKIVGIQQISIVHGIGEKIESIQNSVDRVGFVISQGNSVEEAIGICQKAIDLIKITVRK